MLECKFKIVGLDCWDIAWKCLWTWSILAQLAVDPRLLALPRKTTTTIIIMPGKVTEIKRNWPGGTLNVKVSSNFGLSSPERILVRCLLLRVGSNMSRTCECCVPPRSFVGISRASCTVTDIRPTSPDERELATTGAVSPTSYHIISYRKPWTTEPSPSKKVTRARDRTIIGSVWMIVYLCYF